MNKLTQIICLSLIISGCSGISDYAKNILSDPRNEKLVYKTDDDYSSSQIDLIIPPDLSQPNTRNSLTLPEIVKNDSFVIDRSLDSSKFEELSGYKPKEWKELINNMKKFR